jgi:hypothetical protein
VSVPARVLLSTMRLVTVAITALLLAVPDASAQVLYGNIVGNVTDAQGSAVPGATVTIVNKETNLTREVTTNEEGNFTVGNVLPGRYDVKVSLQGFREVVRANVPVVIGQLSRVDTTLEVGTLSETVTVTSQAELLQTDSAEVSTQLKSTEIAALPLNQFRNYQALVNLVPGSTPMRFQNAETDTPARSLTTNMNGQAINSNATRTDGATNVNIWLPSHNMYVSPAETIDTVSISTNNFDAEQGMAGGAAITVITKSGTNQFKGSAFEFFNNDAMNASPYYFGGPRADGKAKPDKLPVERNIYGATLGGPIKRDRLFFFGSYEGYKSEQSLFTFFNVPDAALRNGDFSNARNADGSLQIIYDPLTGNPDGSGRLPFPGNRIPADRINSIARRIDQLAPMPNTQGTGVGGFTNNYQREETRATDRHNFDAKINWNRTSAHQLWGKFSFMDATVDDLTNYLGPDPAADGDGGFTKVWQFTMGQTWTLGPTTIMDSTFGFSRQDQDVLGPDFDAGYYGLDTLGIPGTNDPIDRDPRYAGYPRFDTGFSPLGNRDGWNPIFRDERTYSFATNLTKLVGAHEFRGGYLLNFLYLDHWQPESDNPRGRLQFATNATALRGSAAGNFYNQYAAFLLGQVGIASKSVQNELMTGREWQHGLFFRDRWTVSPKLTLDLGIRWEYYPIMRRADRGLERVDLDTLEVILGGVGGNPENVGLEAAKDNFAPRLGAIYRLDDESVVRGGYGVTYNPVPWARVLRGDNAYPLTIANTYNAVDPFAPFGTIEQGIPLLRGPDTSSGRVPLPNATVVYTPEPGNIDRGYIHSWNVAYERRLPWNLSGEVAYVGTRGEGGYAALDVNAPQVIGGGNQSRPYFNRGRIQALNSFGQRLITRYQSVQFALNRPLTDGLLIKGAYTLSRAKNNASGSNAVTGPGGGNDEDGRVSLAWNTLSELDRNYAVSGFDRTHNLQIGFLYQLPWQSGGGYQNIGRAIVSDWQINGVFGAFSGLPFTVRANQASLNTPSNLQTGDLVGDLEKVGAAGSAGTFYDVSAFAQPTGVRFGNTGRNQFRGPGGVNLDLSLFRAFSLGETRRLEFRVEAGNITNTPKFANPAEDMTSPNFMRITQVANNNGQAQYAERNIRVGLRFSF